MRKLIQKKHSFLYNIMSRIAFAVVLSVSISVLLAQVINSMSSSPDYAASEPVAFISSSH